MKIFFVTASNLKTCPIPEYPARAWVTTNRWQNNEKPSVGRLTLKPPVMYPHHNAEGINSPVGQHPSDARLPEGKPPCSKAKQSENR